MSRLDIAGRLKLLARGDNLDLVDIVCADAVARIEALEAALREIIALDDTGSGNDWHDLVLSRKIARAALDQDAGIGCGKSVNEE